MVLQSHLRNKTRFFDTIFTGSLFGLSENGIRTSAFQLHPALLKLLESVLLMCMGTASEFQLPCPPWPHQDMSPQEVSPFPLYQISYCTGSVIWTLGKLSNYTLCLSRNIKILATSLSPVLNSLSYCKFYISKSKVMELSWLHWLDVS